RTRPSLVENSFATRRAASTSVRPEHRPELRRSLPRDRSSATLPEISANVQQLRVGGCLCCEHINSNKPSSDAVLDTWGLEYQFRQRGRLRTRAESQSSRSVVP